MSDGRTEARVGLAATTNEDFSSRRCQLHVVTEMIAELVSTDFFAHVFRGSNSGAGGIRTPDLRRATTALFLLSYSPKVVFVREV